MAPSPAMSALANDLVTANRLNLPSPLPYEEAALWAIHRHLLALSDAFPSFSATASLFTHNDGSSAVLLRVEGFVPTPNDQSHRLPKISIWLIEAYPYLPPIVFLSSPGSLFASRHPYVDRSGVVSVPYLRSWLFPNSNLVELVRSLPVLFTLHPPFYSTPKDDIIAEIVAAVHRHLRQGETNTESLLTLQALLKQREEIINLGMRELEKEMMELEQKLQMVRMDTDVVETWLWRSQRRPRDAMAPDIGDVFDAGDTITRQVMESAAADLAVEDTIYALDRSVREGCVSLGEYLRRVRDLSREQFFCRVTLQRLR
ncbi:protein ELC-like [Typha latifolia]|uniref:protein ELC-like n=1 Tax=Typha latifolia TaxID=4733 RepID=UPI003C2D2517